MKHMKLSTAGLLILMLGACSSSTTMDSGIDSGSLSAMHAGIWVDGEGCDHWIIDDGFEGYMSPRMNPDGTLVCRDGAEPWSTAFFQRRLIGSKSE